MNTILALILILILVGAFGGVTLGAIAMTPTTILILVLVVLLVGGGGWYYRR